MGGVSVIPRSTSLSGHCRACVRRPRYKGTPKARLWRLRAGDRARARRSAPRLRLQPLLQARCRSAARTRTSRSDRFDRRHAGRGADRQPSPRRRPKPTSPMPGRRAEVLGARREGRERALGKSRAPARAERSRRSPTPIPRMASPAAISWRAMCATVRKPGCRAKPAASIRASWEVRKLRAVEAVAERSRRASRQPSRCTSATISHPTLIAHMTVGASPARRIERCRSQQECATPMRFWGCRKAASADRHQEAPSASSPRSCIRTPTRTTRKRRPNSPSSTRAYEILGDEKKRKAFDRGEIDAEGKPRFHGFEGHPAAGRAAASVGPSGNFETFSWGPGRIPPHRGARRPGRRAAASAASRTFSRHVRRRGARGGGRRASRPRNRPAIRGQDITAPRRHPERSRPWRRCRRLRAADRQRNRGQDSGRHRRRPAIPAQGPGLSGPRRPPATC